MKELFWRALARIVSHPRIADHIIHRALQRPYKHVWKDGDLYMKRFWVANAFLDDLEEARRKASGRKLPWRLRHLPSVRVQWIRRPDGDDHPHDHISDCRTIIMRNGYTEDRLELATAAQQLDTSRRLTLVEWDWFATNTYRRKEGDTVAIRHGEYHQITAVHPQGAWTLFIVWPKKGEWGFLVNGVKMYWKDYLARHQRRATDKQPLKEVK